MPLFYVVLFFLLVLFSGFFSSAETALLSLNRIRLGMRSRQGDRRARLLEGILKNPDDFFSTILIGNNLVNIAAASITTMVFSRYLIADESMAIVVSTIVTTIIVLLFAEVLPKSYAFRRSERLSFLYAYPIRFFKYLFYPIVRTTSLFQRLFFRKPLVARRLTPGEVKHFLESQTQLFRFTPENLRMINEIIDISQKDIKGIMTPRVNVMALDESAGIDELKRLMVEKRMSRVPLYRENLDHITGVVHAGDVLAAMLNDRDKKISLRNMARLPLFVSEYSSINYVVSQFREHRVQMAVILDEYGVTIGVLTLNDIFTEILGGIDMPRARIRKVAQGVFQIPGNIMVKELNEQLNLQLPLRKEYTTLNGLFIFHHGRIPRAGTLIQVGNIQMKALSMGRARIREIRLRRDAKPA